MKESLTSVGGAGSILSAIAGAAPCCLPFLASIASTIGLSTLLPYSLYTTYLVQGFGILAVAGAYLSYKQHGKHAPLLLSTTSVAALIFVYNVTLLAWLLYAALAGLVVAAIWNMVEVRRCQQCATPS